MSARNLARRTEIHHSFVSLILSGKRTRVSADIATRIAAALGVKPAVLFRPAPTNTKRIGVKRGGEK
jgi:transcriptional regulator with XRE-family HTH domain